MTASRPQAAVLLICLFIAGFVLGVGFSRRMPDVSAYDALIEEHAAAFDLDPNLLRALVATESGGDPEAISSAGAVGLCQLMPATAAEQATRLRMTDYTRERLTDPAVNLKLGASYLARQLRSFKGDLPFALGAYNAGGTNVRRWRRRAPHLRSRDVIRLEGFAETRGFVARVLTLRRQYANT
ncbi:MAG: lytic transglycosylase domain-containing protein [Planctomycetota bacterium]|nr:lytic transglycosylase domain-containing protein [Planctomycetota bacterium]